MKSRALVLVGTLCAAIAVAVIAEDVTSVNAVGFVRNNCPTGTWTQVQIPFDEMGTNVYDVTSVFGTSMPTNTVVWFWNKWNQVWYKETYAYNLLQSRAMWTPGTNVFSPGQGLFIQMPASAPLPTYTVTFHGEVPSAPTTSVQVVAGYTMLGLPYPVQTLFTDTAFAKNPRTNDVAWAWNQALGSWRKETYAYNLLQSKAMWTPGTMILQPGQAFFYQTDQIATKDLDKPYLWP